MSYLVLARKYRPQTFSEVVGQEHVTRTLANAFRADRVHHAFLFCGPRGCGKTTTARILAKALNCEQGPTPEPCGVCSSCTTITGGTAVDYFEMDGASNRGIDAVRELTDAVRYQPAVLRKKVYVIDEVHMLTTEAFNALLKTLEEPPPHVTFVMATTEPHKVPNTVLSRCQRYDFKLVPSARLSSHLESIFGSESMPVDAGAVNLIVRESGGSVRDALSLSDQVISYVGGGVTGEGISEASVAEVLGVADRALTRTLTCALAEGDAKTALESVEAAVARGVDEVQIARAIVRFLRDLAATQVAPDATGIIDATEQERADLSEIAKRYPRSRVLQMFDRMIRCADELSRLPQPRLILDLALIDLASLEPLVPLGDLLDRLSRMEARLGPGSSGGGSEARRDQPPASRASPAPGPAASRPAASPAPSPASSRPAAPSPAPVPASSRPSAPSAAPVAASSGPSGSRPASSGPPAPGPQAQAPSAEPSSHPPAAAAPASSAPGTTGDLTARWDAILDVLGEESERLPLVQIYENAKIMTWTDESIVVGYANDSFEGELAADADKVAEMKSFLAHHFGAKIGFKVELLNAAQVAAAPQARSVLEYRREQADKERGVREAEAREHPLTKVVLETFGASIKEIKVDV